ncbi:MAG: IS1634 family transposase [Patescibacteria group bacterium]|nr:IS1634 family transposase [Patescibacteria group bacterium]
MYSKLDGQTRQVRTRRGSAEHRVHHVGPLPIIRHFLDRMAFSRIVGSCLGPGRMTPNHAQTLAVLIQNILLSPSPLYRIAEWADPFSAAALGLNATEKGSINDDRVARALDALISVSARSLFFRMALHVIKQFEIDTKRIHHDTTTVTFHGQYAGSFAEPRITQGMNKDHRPDLKQLVFGVNISADGAVPLSHEVYSGNRTDDTVHRGNVDYLRRLLGRDDFIYVADCKLATRKNLDHIQSYGGKFVSVLPRTRAEDQFFRRQLREGLPAHWRRFLVLENKRRRADPPDVYSTTSAGPRKTEEGYRLLWCRSSQKAEHDERAREASLRRTEAELFDLAARANTRALRTRSSILQAAKAILRKLECKPFFEIKLRTETRIEKRRLHCGRPGKNDPVREIRSRIFRLEYKRIKEAIRAESRTDGVFPLVTNLLPRRVSKKELLLIYKYQPYVEKRHALMKTELEVAPVYLKKPHRAAALVHAVFLAMMVNALIERALRKGMTSRRLESLPILPEGRPSKTPTTARLLEMFSGVCWYEFERGEETVTFPIKLTPLQRELLELLEVDRTAYA